MSIVIFLFGLFIATCGFSDITNLGLLSKFAHKNFLEKKLLFELSERGNRRGHILSFPATIPSEKKFIIAKLLNKDEDLFVVENDEDVTHCIKTDDRVYYYLIDACLIIPQQSQDK